MIDEELLTVPHPTPFDKNELTMEDEDIAELVAAFRAATDKTLGRVTQRTRTALQVERQQTGFAITQMSERIRSLAELASATDKILATALRALDARKETEEMREALVGAAPGETHH
jgi:hypothetical protein